MTALFVSCLDSKVNPTSSGVGNVDGIHLVFSDKQHHIAAAHELPWHCNRHEWTTGFYICALNNACGLIQRVDACALIQEMTELLADVVRAQKADVCVDTFESR